MSATFITPASELRIVTQRDRRGISLGDIVEHQGELGEVIKLNARTREVTARRLKVSAVELDKAAQASADFAGKPPDRLTKYPAKKIAGAAWALGQLVGVMYEADTDEGKQTFFHRFKKSARPTLAVTHNGHTLVTLGGAFQVTERGIVDR